MYTNPIFTAKQSAQVMLDYVVVFCIALVVITGMGVYTRNALSGKSKEAGDTFGSGEVFALGKTNGQFIAANSISPVSSTGLSYPEGSTIGTPPILSSSVMTPKVGISNNGYSRIYSAPPVVRTKKFTANNKMLSGQASSRGLADITAQAMGTTGPKKPHQSIASQTGPQMSGMGPTDFLKPTTTAIAAVYSQLGNLQKIMNECMIVGKNMSFNMLRNVSEMILNNAIDKDMNMPGANDPYRETLIATMLNFATYLMAIEPSAGAGKFKPQNNDFDQNNNKDDLQDPAPNEPIKYPISSPDSGSELIIASTVDIPDDYNYNQESDYYVYDNPTFNYAAAVEDVGLKPILITPIESKQQYVHNWQDATVHEGDPNVSQTDLIFGVKQAIIESELKKSGLPTEKIGPIAAALAQVPTATLEKMSKVQIFNQYILPAYGSDIIKSPGWKAAGLSATKVIRNIITPGLDMVLTNYYGQLHASPRDIKNK